MINVSDEWYGARASSTAQHGPFALLIDVEQRAITLTLYVAQSVPVCGLIVPRAMSSCALPGLVSSSRFLAYLPSVLWVTIYKKCFNNKVYVVRLCKYSRAGL